MLCSFLQNITLKMINKQTLGHTSYQDDQVKYNDM